MTGVRSRKEQKQMVPLITRLLAWILAAPMLGQGDLEAPLEVTSPWLHPIAHQSPPCPGLPG